MVVSDDTLTTCALGGDADALSVLLEQCDCSLRSWLRRRIKRAHQAALDVDDVLQVTYLEVFLEIGRFKRAGPGSFQAWVRRTAENNLRDAVRGLGRAKRPRRSRQVGGDGSDDSYAMLLADLGASITTPSEHAVREEASTLLEDALRKLPPDYEKVVRSCDLLGRSASEVAVDMNRSPGAIHMLKARAHDRLVTLLGPSSRFFPR